MYFKKKEEQGIKKRKKGKRRFFISFYDIIIDVQKFI